MCTLNFKALFQACFLAAIGVALTLPVSLAGQVDLMGKPLKGYSATPPDMWEVGLHTGSFISIGDVDFQFGPGGGFHVRKAIDYVFSLRADGQFGQFRGENGQGSHRTDFRALSLQLLMSVNNLVWNGEPKRAMNMYLLVGAGMNNFSTSVKGTGFSPATGAWVSQLEAGAGVSFRVTDRVNIGVESKLYLLLGAGVRADLIDGRDNADNDVPTYTSVRVNFNMGNSDKRSEPLYWVNPMDVVLKDISELKERPVFDPTDSDNDGVVDMLDQEPHSPPGAPVDTRGITLDSDRDGVPDYKDEEPFSPPGARVNGLGISLDEPGRLPPDKNAIREIVEQVLEEYNYSPEAAGSEALTEWFLPMIHFDIDQTKIREVDYGYLAAVARVLKQYPHIRLVVKGFTDQTASSAYNELLSYKRALAVIDFLTKKHGIARNRLVLHYGGEDESLVPGAGSSFMNRRVEFHLAKPDETDMPPPKKTKKRY